MRHDQIVYFTVIVLVVLSGAHSDAYAQSGAFPAFSPEPALIGTGKETAKQPPKQGFPAFSTSTQPKSSGKPAFPTPKFGQQLPQISVLSFEDLGRMLHTMSMEPTRVQARYDFLYHAKFDGQEMELFFSILLGKDGSDVRVKAWLDPLPERTVSQEPLLEMLSRNEGLNQGLRFSYSRQMNRFLLEKTVLNQNITPELLGSIFQDVSLHVAENWETWSTSQWKMPAEVIRESVVPEDVVPEVQFEMPIRR